MVADPRKRPLTFRDFLALPEDEDREREIIRGRLYVTAKPSWEHQWLLKKLSRVLDDHVLAAGEDHRQVLPDADLVMDDLGSYGLPDLISIFPD